jgi:hypothetical protein
LEVEDDPNAEDDEDELEDALAEAVTEILPATTDVVKDVRAEWKGASIRQAAGNTYYKYSPKLSLYSIWVSALNHI